MRRKKSTATANLRLSTQYFLEKLIPETIVGRLDTRVTAPNPKQPLVAGRDKAADDPALHMGASNVIKSKSIKNYLRDEIGLASDRDYIALSLDVNFAWDWRSPSASIDEAFQHDHTPNIAKLMKDRPTARLLSVAGYYDLAVPALFQRYVLTHSEIPTNRTQIVLLPGGHTVYKSTA